MFYSYYSLGKTVIVLKNDNIYDATQEKDSRRHATKCVWNLLAQAKGTSENDRKDTSPSE